MAAHGQLYVALSRVRKPGDIVFAADAPPNVQTHQATHPGTYTRNVVYTEVLS